jgi:hypothetical protein
MSGARSDLRPLVELNICRPATLGVCDDLHGKNIAIIKCQCYASGSKRGAHAFWIANYSPLATLPSVDCIDEVNRELNGFTLTSNGEFAVAGAGKFGTLHPT